MLKITVFTTDTTIEKIITDTEYTNKPVAFFIRQVKKQYTENYNTKPDTIKKISIEYIY